MVFYIDVGSLVVEYYYMIGKINSGVNNFFKPQNKANKLKGETELSVFYMNDAHGDINRAANMKTAKDCFEKQNKAGAHLTLAAGDMLYGNDPKRIGFITKFLNAMKIDATAVGNHEFHYGSEFLAKNLKNIDTTAVCCNIDIPEGNGLKDRMAEKKLVKSAVFMKGGHKFGIIGASPFDTDITVKEKQDGTGIKQMSVDQTIKAINEEAKNLEKQGINKIILCTHTGYGEHADLRIAKETEGVDIIIGGHSHTVIDGANKEDKGGDHKLNVVKSRRGEPVVITQAGKLNKYAGFLNVIFDKNGVIKEDSIVNKLTDTKEFAPNKGIQNILTATLGQNKVLSNPKHTYMPINEFQDRYMENPVVNVVSDAILAGARKVDKDVIAELHPTNNLKKCVDGPVTTYNVKYDMLPYNCNYAIVEITEEDLVKTLEATSGNLFKDFDPELLRCAGMRYTIDENADKGINGHIKSLEFVDDKNNVIKSIDVKNPSKTNKLKIVMDTFLFKEKNTKDILAPYTKDAKSVGTEQDLFINYLEENKDVDFDKKPEKRIQINYQNLDKYCYQYPMEDKYAALGMNK